jgi:hypothetical protein
MTVDGNPHGAVCRRMVRRAIRDVGVKARTAIFAALGLERTSLRELPRAMTPRQLLGDTAFPRGAQA